MFRKLITYKMRHIYRETQKF